MTRYYVFVDSGVAMGMTVERVVCLLNTPYSDLGRKFRIDFVDKVIWVIVSNHQLQRD